MGGGFERAERLEHQTLGVQRLAVRSEDYWDFKPEQRVKTIDGVTGVVKRVEDGPFPGSEEYHVELDQGMGGGRYTASQLSPAPITAEAMEQTAAADYPELSQILVERPDPARQFVTAGKNPFADNDGDSDDEPDGDSDDAGGDDPDEDDSKDSDDEGDDSDDSDDAPPWAKKASALFSGLVVTAATDADFRFHVTAAWRDVVAKAKRIRAEGRLRVTMASDGLVFAEVKGDHEVYETGLQRMPGKVAAHSWSCGCKWGAYHWGADDDFSRFAGRMCSHALALQYEAQSRGMFGRDVHADEHKPTWVPRKVVVRYDIDADTNRLAPSTAAARPDDSGAPLSVVARAAVAAGEDREEMLLALAAAGISPGQGELFDASPYQREKPPAPSKAPATCEDCGEPRDRNHASAHAEYMRQFQKGYTNWDDEYHNVSHTIHRGMALDLPADVHKVVHDSDRPVQERAHALMNHIKGNGQGLGSFYSDDLQVSRNYAANSRVPSGNDHTPVVVHVAKPGRRNIITNQQDLQDKGVYSYTEPNNSEIPLKDGSPVKITGVSWADPKSAYSSSPSENWVRHDFPKPHRHTANANAPFGEPSGTSYVLPKTPGATAPRKVWENPASAGPLAGADPAGWNRVLPLQAYSVREEALFEPGGVEAELHDEPEGALPSTDGAVPTDEASDLTPSMTAGLKRHALKDFTLAEQQALINEGEGVRAANLDRLDIAGTHYADLESVLAAQEDDTTWLA